MSALKYVTICDDTLCGKCYRCKNKELEEENELLRSNLQDEKARMIKLESLCRAVVNDATASKHLKDGARVLIKDGE